MDCREASPTSSDRRPGDDPCHLVDRLSANFLASDFIFEEEIPEFFSRCEKEKNLIIFPVIAKDCGWREIGWLVKMQVRPKGGKPIWSKGADVDTELAKITGEVTEIIKNRWLSEG